MLHSNAMFCLLPALRDWDRAGEGKHKSSQSVGREAKHCQMQSLQYTSEASRVIEAGTETPSLSSRPTAQWSFLYNFVQKLLMPQTPFFAFQISEIWLNCITLFTTYWHFSLLKHIKLLYQIIYLNFGMMWYLWFLDEILQIPTTVQPTAAESTPVYSPVLLYYVV